MSTSPSRAPAEVEPVEPEAVPALQPFPYDLVPAGATTGLAASGIRSWTMNGSAADAAAREAQARAQGRQEGQAEGRKVFEEHLARERSSVVAALVQFHRDRTDYFRKVEGEIVQLALSIARKILHREAQLDPLLLAGIVRVALEKIDGATKIGLRVHPQRAAEWRKYLSEHMTPEHIPEVEEDPGQSPDCCVLQTSMGTAIVGVEVQLKEIEQGLMDMLAGRPGAGS